MWQPIETAPKDGTHIIVYPAFSNKRAYGVKWNNGKRKQGWVMQFGTDYIPCTPKFWLPMPSVDGLDV